MLGKKAQIGETMTWVVATIIIVFVIMMSIYAASLMGKAKGSDVSSFVGESLSGISGLFDSDDLLMKQSIFAYFLISEDKRSEFYGDVSNENFYGDFDGEFKKVGAILNEK